LRTESVATFEVRQAATGAARQLHRQLRDWLAHLALTDGEYWGAVVESGRALQRYLAALPEGLWYDTLTVNGRLIAEPSPASTLYHLVAAIAQLDGALAMAPGSAATR